MLREFSFCSSYSLLCYYRNCYKVVWMVMHLHCAGYLLPYHLQEMLLTGVCKVDILSLWIFHIMMDNYSIDLVWDSCFLIDLLDSAFHELVEWHDLPFEFAWTSKSSPHFCPPSGLLAFHMFHSYLYVLNCLLAGCLALSLGTWHTLLN